ncbi:hypothetical protein HKB31_16635 [Vibrio alginolyticus]|uniref:hypothetical protein n=1 Tax=Vibrio TaxID=662 RepID=UPI00146A89B5|nr:MULTISPECIES: hypothetical protein [Vibrio]MBS9822615.1 hypothetical protein [Vibrio alginolyticus]MDW2301446.1 hypothetical protein [Vibrio sp. 1167]NMT95388.1 hypothetical protein [Vibrio alginolyticus]
MTTTIFRKNNDQACIASDSRVTWVDKNQGLPTKWFDSIDFLKTMMIDGVMYGFAGTNVMFKLFLQNYTTKADSEFLLDTIVQLAQVNQVQFFIIRFDGTNLKLFAYSPPGDAPEILRISTDPAIDKGMYAIGSGKYSKEYKKNRANKNAQVPIRKIITANRLGLKKARILDLDKKVSSGVLTHEESQQAYFACQSKGGDLFTGGEVKMTKSVTRQQMDEQVAILDRMDQQAKATGAVCASPVDASLEVKQLHSLGQYAVSPNSIEVSEKRTVLLEKMQSVLHASI